MDLQKLTDEELHESSLQAVRTEGEDTLFVLNHLREIDRRRIYSKYKCRSLQDYAERVLKYPDDQAYVRIAAMRLLNELPELADRLRSRELSLSHLTDARKLFRKKKYSREEMLKFCDTVAGKTTREAQRIIAEIIPEIALKDRVRAATADKMEFRFYGSYELNEKLKRLTSHYAHTHPGLNLGDLIDMLADIGLERVKYQTKSTSRQHKDSHAEVIRQVQRRDSGCCVNCGSHYAVEVDHIVPKALGGLDTLENLRLLCRNCNQRYAIEIYGVSKMSSYLKDPIVGYR